MAWAGFGDGGGARARLSTPKFPAGISGPAGSMGPRLAASPGKLPLLPLGLEPLEVDGAEQAPEDDATMEKNAMEAGQLFAILSRSGCGLAYCCCGGCYPVWWACRGNGGLVLWHKTGRLTLDVGPCLSLDLSCTCTQGAQWARSYSISPALKAT